MSNSTYLHEHIDALSKNITSDNQRSFFQRVWKGGLNNYEARIKALGFSKMDSILDAGCGFGQWTFALANLNRTVTGIDLCNERINICQQLKEIIGNKNLEFLSGSIENLPYEDNSFDGIFSYSVIYLTDYRKTLKEYHRVLKPGGLVYFCTNGLGWYLHNLIETHNDAKDFSSRDMAKETFDNSINYYATGKHCPGKSIIMQSHIIKEELEVMGFEIIGLSSEGTINDHIHNVAPFYPPTQQGHENVWEALCKKKS